jgi:predicted CoA-binding protein
MTLSTEADIRDVLESCRTVAVVGCSPNPDRAGHYVAQFLQEKGYRVIPVNPGHKTLLGENCYPSLRDIPEPVDMVDCFRSPEHMPDVVEDAIAIGAKVVWMQLGVINKQAAERAEAAGLKVVMNRCPIIEYPRVFHDR